MSLYPPYLSKKLPDLLTKYIIRPYQPEDGDQVRTIFKEGMNYYADSSLYNTINTFPTFDEHHAQHMETKKDLWANAFPPYTEYCLTNPALSQIPEYWNISRRSVFLVATLAEDPTVVCGTVAIQPIEYNAGDCLYTNSFVQMRNELISALDSHQDHHPSPQHQNHPHNCINTMTNLQSPDDTNMINFAQFNAYCNLAIGSLPADFYALDDPSYLPSSFSPQWTVMLPEPKSLAQLKLQHSTTPSSNSTSYQDTEFVPNDPKSANCACSIAGTCTSKRMALEWVKSGLKQQMEQYRAYAKQHNTTSSTNNINTNTESDDSNQDKKAACVKQFCSCIVHADTLLLQLAQTPGLCPRDGQSTLICPFCISDAQYFVQPYILESSPQSQTDSIDEVVDKTSQTYILNPVLTKYSNHISNLLNLSSSSSSSPPTTIASQLPFYTTSPPGFYRRMTASWVNLDEKMFLQQSMSNKPNQIASTSIDAYVKYLASSDHPDHENEGRTGINSEDENMLRTHCDWATNFPTPGASPSYTPTPYFNCCELRRMSITAEGGHRGTGLGAFLFFTALAFAKLVLKFEQLHLSTSFYTMDVAVKFYRRMGLREADCHFEVGGEEWPVCHYTIPFTTNGVKYDLKRWVRTQAWNDVEHIWIQQQQHQQEHQHQQQQPQPQPQPQQQQQQQHVLQQ